MFITPKSILAELCQSFVDEHRAGKNCNPILSQLRLKKAYCFNFHSEVTRGWKLGRVGSSAVWREKFQLWHHTEGVCILTLASVNGVASGKSLNISEPLLLI